MPTYLLTDFLSLQTLCKVIGDMFIDVSQFVTDFSDMTDLLS